MRDWLAGTVVAVDEDATDVDAGGRAGIKDGITPAEDAVLKTILAILVLPIPALTQRNRDSNCILALAVWCIAE